MYQVEDLGTTPDGLVPTVTGMNAVGQVSGYVTRADGGLRAVRYTNGSGWSYLPGLQSVYSAATAINASGDLAGYHLTPAFALRAFRYVDGIGMTVIPALPGGSFAIGFAIADNGDVVGYGNSFDGTRAWRASPGLLPVVPAALTSTSQGCGVNSAGQMVGSFTTSAGFQHAFRLESDGSLTDIGTLEGPSSTSAACAIDADGRVGGRSSLADTTRAFVTAGITPANVDSFASTFSNVEAISNGVAVGTFTFSETTGQTHAFVNTTTDGTSDLNTRLPAGSGWILSGATAVNSNGQIAGNGLVAGSPRAFRLTPGAAAADTTAPVITSVTATPSTIWPPKGQTVSVSTLALATDNSGETPACTLAGITLLGAPTSDASVTGANTGTVKAVGGRTYSFNETCVDGSGNSAPASVNVTVPPDVTAPAIATLTATPSSVTPPNRALVPVTVSVGATDDVDDAPACSLSSITAAGAAEADSSITGPFAAAVRAVGGRTYSLTVTCTDAAGNPATRSVDVVVPPDTTAPVITSVTATPSTIWPPKGQTVSVSTLALATDDSGETPACTLASITLLGAPTSDASVTGANTGTVKAVGGRTYSFNETCVDGSGNSAPASVNVTVPPDVTAPAIATLTATPSSITPPNRAMVPVTVSVGATDDVDDAPVCALSTITGGPGGDFVITGPFSAAVKAVGGRTYSLRVSCSDAAGNDSARSVNVVVPPDTTPPVVTSLVATPAVVWPPNDALVAVTVAVSAADDSAEAPACALSAITGSGTPSTADDYSITGQYSARVRATGGRTYSLRVTCADAAGNSRDASVNVVVPADTNAPVITALSASPDHIWPPNGKMEKVTLTVTAADDVDAAPTCSLTSITGAPAADAVVTGPFTANVRSERDAIYTFNVGCADKAGNRSQASVRVAVSKDSPSAAKTNHR